MLGRLQLVIQCQWGVPYPLLSQLEAEKSEWLGELLGSGLSAVIGRLGGLV